MVGGYFDYLMMSKAGSATTPQTATGFLSRPLASSRLGVQVGTVPQVR